MTTQENLAETISKQINEIDFNSLVEQAFNTVFDIGRAVVSKGNQKTIDHLKNIFGVGEFQNKHFLAGNQLQPMFQIHSELVR